METLSFENLPNAVGEILKRQTRIEALLLQKAEPQSEPDNPLAIKEVAALTGLSVPTLYGYCQRNEIPYHKKGNRLYFFKSQIIEWIKAGKQKTILEIEEEANLYLKK